MDPSSVSPLAASHPVRTVRGEVPYEQLGITDAHNHVWIEPVPGADPGAPVLNQVEPIQRELIAYRSAGGGSLLDCQPGGCGRNAGQLIRLAQKCGVNIIACTGFHRKKYYSPGFWLFSAPEAKVAEYLVTEYTQALEECRDQQEPPRAGFLKIALESEWKETPLAAMEAAAAAAQTTGSLIEIHTEQGALAERAVVFFEDRGVVPRQLVLCHMDKRPDIGLHAELCKYGVLLEYDTFYRPKYAPEEKLWPLIQNMVYASLSNRIALATDMADAKMYQFIGKGPGLASLPAEIQSRLIHLEVPANAVQQMLGGNIARRLAGLL